MQQRLDLLLQCLHLAIECSDLALRGGLVGRYAGAQTADLGLQRGLRVRCVGDGGAQVVDLCGELADRGVAKAFLNWLWCSTFMTKDFPEIINEPHKENTISR